MFEVNVTFRRGFPLVVRGRICNAEPDVGFMHDYIDEYEILTANMNPTEFLNITDHELSDIEDQVRKALFD